MLTLCNFMRDLIYIIRFYHATYLATECNVLRLERKHELTNILKSVQYEQKLTSQSVFSLSIKWGFNFCGIFRGEFIIRFVKPPRDTLHSICAPLQDDQFTSDYLVTNSKPQSAVYILELVNQKAQTTDSELEILR